MLLLLLLPRALLLFCSLRGERDGDEEGKREKEADRESKRTEEKVRALDSLSTSFFHFQPLLAFFFFFLHFLFFSLQTITLK